MKIFVIGASGRVGHDLCAILLQKGHQVTAGARHRDSLADLSNLPIVSLDLHDNVPTLAATIGQPDILYFVAGSRSQDLLEVDIYGALKAMQIAAQNHIKRFIMLSAYGALDPNFWDKLPIRQYYLSKYLTDYWLTHDNSIDYTILQPATLTETPPTGKVALQVTEPGTNAIADVAAVLAALLDHPNTNKKVIAMHAGNTPIDQALTNI